MKKILALILATIMCMVAFTACGDDEAKTDLDYVKENGKLIVGITDFAPMDYQEEGSDEWIGFDADMAKAFAKKLGVEVEFVVINWKNKIPELNSKTIDCVWNGMTLTDEVKNGMETSNPYCQNAQVVVLPKDKAEQFTTVESIKDLNFAAENGSAGLAALEELGYKVTPVTKQADAVMEVAAGTSDACVIDLLMAGAMIGEGTSYPDLTYSVNLSEEPEEYGVGFRKGSNLAEELNKFFAESYKDGSMMDIAKKYGVHESIIEQK